MTKVLLDTNVILDIALERHDNVEKSQKVMLLLNKNGIPAYISATTVTDIYYILKKSKGHHLTIGFLKNLFEILTLLLPVINQTSANLKLRR